MASIPDCPQHLLDSASEAEAALPPATYHLVLAAISLAYSQGWHDRSVAQLDEMKRREVAE